MTREDAHKSISRHRDGKFDANDGGKLLHRIYDDFEAQLKAKDEEIERLKVELMEAIVELEEEQRLKCASIEEIEHALSKPEYASVYLNNALRFLKEKQK